MIEIAILVTVAAVLIAGHHRTGSQVRRDARDVTQAVWQQQKEQAREAARVLRQAEALADECRRCRADAEQLYRIVDSHMSHPEIRRIRDGG